MPLTEKGLEVLRTADFLILIRDALAAELAARGQIGSADFDRDTLLGGLTAVMADRLGVEAELLQAVYDARDPSNATGVQLSSLALAIGVTRNEPTPSVARLVLAGTDGTIIPAGRQVRGGGVDGQALWTAREDRTIGATVSGTVNSDFEADVPGSTLAPAGTEWEIVTPILGWTAATNVDDATPGLDRETDDELRVRRQESLQIIGSASTRSIRARLLEVEGVQAVAVIENPDGIPRVREGLFLEAFSVGVVLFPSTLSTEELEAAVEVIYDNVCAGIETSGTLSASVVGLDITPKIIRFSFPVIFEVVTDVTVEMEPESPTFPDPPTFADVEDEIVAAIEAFEAALTIGEDVRTLPILAAIEAVEGVRSATVVLTVPAAPSKVQATGDVSILAAELADLTITVVEA